MNYPHNFDPDIRRGSRSRALERSLSYSEAIGNGSDGRASIEIPRLDNTDVYFNEELKKQYRISQTYVEGKEIAFPTIITNIDTNEPIPSSGEGLLTDESKYSSEDECIVMTIDVDQESPRTDSTRQFSDSTRNYSDSTRNFSNASTQPMNSFQTTELNSYQTSDFYDRIDYSTETDDVNSTIDTTETLGPSAHTYSAPYTRRSKKGTRHR